jgi:hypothetical protein
MRVRAAAMDLRVQLLAEPCLWCWEIVDRRRGDVVRSSWSSEWMAYDSKEEALAAGRRRLSELLLRSAEGALPEQGLAGGRRRAAMVRLIVFVLLVAVVATASTTAAQGPRQATPPAETDGRSRLTVTVQELIQRDPRLTVTAGTEVFWSDPHFERVWFPTGGSAPHVERTEQGFRAVFPTPGTYRGAFTIVGGHRSNDVYPLIVTVTER